MIGCDQFAAFRNPDIQVDTGPVSDTVIDLVDDRQEHPIEVKVLRVAQPVEVKK